MEPILIMQTSAALLAVSAIGGATITARRDAKDIRSTRSNDKGEFVLTGLDAGVYNIVFDAKGYSSGVKFGVEIKQNKTVDLGERLDVARGNLVETCLDVAARRLELADRLADQRLIFQHHLMRVENQRLLLTQVLRDLHLNLRNLLPGDE